METTFKDRLESCLVKNNKDTNRLRLSKFLSFFMLENEQYEADPENPSIFDNSNPTSHRFHHFALKGQTLIVIFVNTTFPGEDGSTFTAIKFIRFTTSETIGPCRMFNVTNEMIPVTDPNKDFNLYWLECSNLRYKMMRAVEKTFKLPPVYGHRRHRRRKNTDSEYF